MVSGGVLKFTIRTYMFFVVVNLDASVLSFHVLSFAIIALLCTSHTHVQCTLMMMMLACGPNLQPQCQNSYILYI